MENWQIKHSHLEKIQHEKEREIHIKLEREMAHKLQIERQILEDKMNKL